MNDSQIASSFDEWPRLAKAPARSGATVPPPPMLTIFANNAVPLTIIWAPSGFGKTTALAHLYDQTENAEAKSTWIDRSNENSDRLGGIPGQSLVDRLRSSGGAIYLDDADAMDPLSLASFINTAIARGLKTFVAARRIEGLRLARHLASGKAQILPAEFLFFQRSALAESSEFDLSAPQISLIHRLAEGWAAPSTLMARYISSGGNSDNIGVLLLNSLTTNFIEEELLSIIPVEWRQSLIALSLLDEFTDELLDRLDPESAITVESLKSYFGPLIIASTHASKWRLNRLLRKHLQLEFAKAKRSARTAMRSIVTDWAAERGDIVAAAALLAQEGAQEQFCELVANAGGVTLWFLDGHHIVKQLAKIADDARFQGDSRFQLLRCASLLKDGRVADATALYEEAISRLPDTKEARRDAAFVQIILMIYCCRDPAPEDMSAIGFLESCAFNEGWSTSLPTIKAIHHLQRAEFDAALGALVEAEKHCLAAGHEYNLLFIDLHRATIFFAQGELTAARKALLQSQARWRRDHRDDQGAEMVLAALFGQLEFESGRLRNAGAYSKRSGAKVLQSEAWLSVYIAALEPMYRLAADQHGVEAALIAIDRMRDQLASGGLGRVANLLAGLRVQLEGEDWLRGDRSAPPVSAYFADTDAETDLMTWHEREFAVLGAAYCDLGRGAFDSATKRLTDFVHFARQRKLVPSLLRTLLLRAASFDLSGNASAAKADFDEALRIGEATGLRQGFAEVGGRYSLKQIVERQGVSEFVRGLGRNDRRSKPSLDTLLTKRECEMLKALALGKADKEIGREIGITEYGVRFHLRNLYVKLGVHSRTAAVAKASLLS